MFWIIVLKVYLIVENTKFSLDFPIPHLSTLFAVVIWYCLQAVLKYLLYLTLFKSVFKCVKKVMKVLLSIFNIISLILLPASMLS